MSPEQRFVCNGLCVVKPPFVWLTSNKCESIHLTVIYVFNPMLFSTCFAYLGIFTSFFCELYTMLLFSFIHLHHFLFMFICSFLNANLHAVSLPITSLSLFHLSFFIILYIWFIFYKYMFTKYMYILFFKYIWKYIFLLYERERERESKSNREVTFLSIKNN